MLSSPDQDSLEMRMTQETTINANLWRKKRWHLSLRTRGLERGCRVATSSQRHTRTVTEFDVHSRLNQHLGWMDEHVPNILASTPAMRIWTFRILVRGVGAATSAYGTSEAKISNRLWTDSGSSAAKVNHDKEMMKQRNLNMRIVKGGFTGQKTNQKFEESEKEIERSSSARRIR